MGRANEAIIEQLQKQILNLQGSLKPPDKQSPSINLGVMEASFPGLVFPQGAVHEFISTSSQEAACTSAFISVILGKLMKQNQLCLWISTTPRRSIFPPALQLFGIEPDRILFVDTAKPKETLWAIEEALKCDALAAVIGELSELNFNDSRRLQLAVEKSSVTGFIHRFRPKALSALACVTRWIITPLESVATDNMPGLGFPSWNVQLLKVRNGKPGEWQVQWSPKGLEYIDRKTIVIPDTHERQTG